MLPYILLIIVASTTIMPRIKYDIEASLGSIVRRAERMLNNRLNQHFKRNGYNVTTEQYRILINLWNRDGQNQQELAEATFKNKTSITRLINSLEKKNLVVRIPDKSDHRNNLIYLTKKGQGLPEVLTGMDKKVLEQAQTGICEDEVEKCKTVLCRVISNLE